MKEHFATYKHALALKELGFNEPCLAHLIGFGDGTKENGKYKIIQQQVFYPNDYTKSDDKAEELGLHPFGICGVPLKQQVFKWFRKNHGLYSAVIPKKADPDNHVTGIEWYVKICGEDGIEIGLAGAYTYEEAETACIDKLIKIVKGGKK